MEQGDDLLQLLLPRFNGEDFEDWKIQMKVMLKSKDLWEVVKKEISSQDKQIKKKDSGALFYIFRAVDKNIFRFIADSSSAYSAWKLIELKYGEAAQESEQSNGPIKHIPILVDARSTNYLDWKRVMKEYMKDKHVSDWDANSIIKQQCHPIIQAFIKDLYSLKDVWNQLDVMHDYHAKGLQPMTAHTWCQDFYNAIVKGKHEKVETFLERNNRVVVSRITAGQDIPLHIAARVGHLKIVKLLLDRMNKEEVMLMNNNYRTALHLAASGGHLNVVMALVEKERRLVLRECDEQIPLHHAIRNQHKKVVEYLFKATIEVDKADAKNDIYEWNKKARNKFRVTILIALIYGNFYDLALKLVNDFPELLLIKDRFKKTAILALIESTSEHETWWAALLTPISISISTSIEYIKSRIFSFRVDRQDEENADQADHLVPRPLKFANEKRRFRSMSPGAFMLLRAICQQIATVGNIEVGDEYDVDDKDMKALIIDALFRAVQKGNVDFIVEILRYRPRIAQLKNNEGMTLFHEAIRCRKDKIFQLINDFDIPTGPAVGDYRDRKTNNNALHLVAELPPVQRRNQISGAAALQLRKEIVWFRKVQAILPPLHQQAKNMDNKTPRMLFNDSHKELFKEGEEWMKQTAEACMVVATLVASVMLSATLALPGATKSDSGISIFIDRYNFNTFVMTNMISLLFSSSSLIAFLSIYITRFAEQDFLVILPWILCIGLLFLYISIASMIANFMSTILMVLRHEMKWVMIPPACLAILPIAILSMRQLPALFQMMLSTYSLGIFTQQEKRLNI